MTAAKHVTVAIKLLNESPTNPRKTFDAKSLKDLAAHIAEKGILQPLHLRPRPGGRYEIVIGHRRYRGAKLAGLDEVPAVVQEMTDLEVVELQLVELSKREDVHPLEEAEGYQVMLRDHQLDEKEIAAKVGCSIAHVKLRLKLCALVPAARKLYLANDLQHGGAMDLARLPTQVQAEAVKAIQDRKNRYRDEGPLSNEEVHEVITREFLLELGDKAGFDTASATLVPRAGPCTTCPKRTGNQGDLFHDINSKDVCTDRSCFALKREAGFKLQAAGAEAKGMKVLSAKEAEKVFSAHGDRTRIEYNVDFVDAIEKPYDGGGKTYLQLLKAAGKEVQITLAQDGNGAARQLIPARAAQAALQKKRRENPPKHQVEQKAAYKAGKAKEELVGEVVERLLPRISEKLVADGGSVAAWRFLVEAFVLSDYRCDAGTLAARRELSEKQLSKAVLETYSKGEIQALLVEALIGSALGSGWNGYQKEFTDACKLAGIDHRQTEQDVKAALLAKKTAGKKGAKSKRSPLAEDAEEALDEAANG